jgi:hypothetical protein
MTMILPTISHEHTYVALAMLLPCGLRAHASTADLCFFQVVDHATDAERLFVRVAALPHRLDDLNSSRVFTLCLTTEQIVQALPWDRAMQARATCDMRELVELHAKQVGGATFPSKRVVPVASPAPAQQQEDVELFALPEVFVSCESVQEAAAEVQAPKRGVPWQKRRRWARLTWLRTAIAMLGRQLSHITQLQSALHAYLASLEHAMRTAFVAQKGSRQPLVCVSPVFIEGRQVGWHLRVGVPLPAALAA